jgi:hypothetical protein
MEGIFVNGPLNVVRLEGMIYNIKKVLYLFFDYHMDVMYQSQCDSIDSIDLNKFIVREFRGAYKDDQNKIFDLFLEITPTAIPKKKSLEFRRRYIDEAMRFFSLEHTADTKVLNNVRYHYIDIRDYLKSNINDMFYVLNNTMHTCTSNNNMTKKEYEDTLAQIGIILDDMKFVYQLLFGGKDKKAARVVEEKSSNYHKTIKNFIDKINTRYTHKDIPEKLSDLRNKIRDYFDTVFGYFSQIQIEMVKAKSILSVHPDSLNEQVIDGKFGGMQYGQNRLMIKVFLYTISTLLYKSDHLVMEGYGAIVDLFFLRRFLDKDYVQNGVVYTGMAHSETYVLTLIKYFGFSMTNAAYMNKDYTMIEANKAIAHSNYYDSLVEKILSPPTVYQCSNVTHFPKNFS